jgi:hypothetical protein
MTPIVNALEDCGLLRSTEKEELLPGREMSRTRLSEIIDVVRVHGETGSHRRPKWLDIVEGLGDEMDSALLGVVGDRTLGDLLDDYEKTNAGQA